MASALDSPGLRFILGPEPSADELSISSLSSSSPSFSSVSYLSSSTALLEYRLLFLLGLSDLILIFVYFCIWKSYSFEVEPFYGDWDIILVPIRLKLASWIFKLVWLLLTLRMVSLRSKCTRVIGGGFILDGVSYVLTL